MKKIIVLFGSIVIGTALFAQAPELKNMMPNSWEKLTRLSEQEEKTLFADETVKEDIKIRKDYYARKNNKEIDIRAYSEVCGGLNFYRILYCNENLDSCLNSEYKNCTITQKEYSDLQDIVILQGLFIKEKKSKLRFIGGTTFHEYWVSQGEWEGFNFSDIMIKQLNKKEIGFFVTEAKVLFKIDRINNDKVNVTYRTLKNQQVGFSQTYFRKYKINDVISTTINNDSIHVTASDYLFDSKCPLKYSIQNAFDGNPATSYVENTEDDLMRIEVSAEGVFDKIRLINGYAKNNELYYSNNRIKSVSSEFDSKSGDMVEWGQKLTEKNERFPVQDGIMINQIVNYFTNGYFFVSDIYKGKLYNDTCLAELDFCRKNGNWVFGDINE